MENYQGINVSSGMGQGLAQVFDAYTPQYDLGEIGIAKYKMRSAQAEANQKKQEKLDKLRDEIKTAKMPPDYLKLFEKTRTEAFDLAKQAQKTGDYEPYYKKRAEAENIAMLGSSIYDKMGSVGNVLMQHPKGVFDGVDAYDTILKGGRNITLADLYDTATSDMDALNSVRMKDKPFDVTTEYNQLQNIINPKQEGRRTFVDEAMAKDGINFAITTDPQWNKFAQAQFAAAPPQEQAKYNGDYVAWGTDNLYKPLLKEVRTPESKDTNISVNVGGGDEGTGVSDVAPQTYNMNLYNPITGKPTEYTMTFDADGFTFAPVEASRAIPAKTFDLNGQPYTKQGIVNMSIGAVVDMPVATKDVNIEGRTFKQGQPIPKEFINLMDKNPSKYKGTVGFKKMATALVDNNDNVIFDLNEVENLIGTNQKWGIKGYGKYKENQTKMNTKTRYEQQYPELFGGKSTPNTTSKPIKIEW